MAPTKKKEVESEREVWFWSLSPTFWHDGCPCDQLFFSSAKVPRDLCVLLSKMVVHFKLMSQVMGGLVNDNLNRLEINNKRQTIFAV